MVDGRHGRHEVAVFRDVVGLQLNEIVGEPDVGGVTRRVLIVPKADELGDQVVPRDTPITIVD